MDAVTVGLDIGTTSTKAVAVDAKGRPLTPGLLYGDSRAASETPGAEMEGFLRWTAAAAPEAHGYWPAQAVANFALGGRPAIDFAVAYISTPVFGSDGWDPDICSGCGVDPK